MELLALLVALVLIGIGWSAWTYQTRHLRICRDRVALLEGQRDRQQATLAQWPEVTHDDATE